jgi:hypothetical protein
LVEAPLVCVVSKPIAAEKERIDGDGADDPKEANEPDDDARGKRATQRHIGHRDHALRNPNIIDADRAATDPRLAFR